MPVVNTNNGNPESAGGSGGSGFPIIVIRTSGQRPSFSGFPFLGNIFGGGNLFPDFQIDEDDDGLFATPVDQSDEEEDGVATVDLDCGLICAIMRNLEGRIKKIQDEITEIQANRENEVDGDGENKPKTTYEEKVSCLFRASSFRSPCLLDTGSGRRFDPQDQPHDVRQRRLVLWNSQHPSNFRI